MSRAAATFDRFFFAREQASTLALVRIALGGLAFVSAVVLWPDLEPFYGPTAIGTRIR